MTSPDYSHQNLQDQSFKGQNLAGANFSGSDLAGCDFTGADLTGANLQWVKTGQSRRQISRLMAGAVIGLLVLIFGSFLLVQLASALLPELVLNVLFKALPVVVLILEILFQGQMHSRYPKTTTFFGLSAIAGLLVAMVLVTLGLVMSSLSAFGDGSGGLGLLLLVLVVVGAIVTRRIFTWLTQTIQSHLGTSFRKANLTDADLSHAQIQNVDFSLATMTGVCVFQWQVNRQTQFNDVGGEYFYLDSQHQIRQPVAGTFQPGELAKRLTQFQA
jgi:hypothetical protein